MLQRQDTSLIRLEVFKELEGERELRVRLRGWEFENRRPFFLIFFLVFLSTRSTSEGVSGWFGMVWFCKGRVEGARIWSSKRDKVK